MMSVFKCGQIFLLFLPYYTLTQGSNCLLPGKQDEPCTCCKSGYMGADCTILCPNCVQMLHENKCLSECRTGYHGKNCEKNCSVNCIWGNSNTPRCEKDNGNCSYGCKPGYYGQQCENECSVSCRDKECSRGDGECYRCNNTRYHGNYCNETCSNGCFDRTCEISGYCISGCENGFYGIDCSMECGNNCINHHCAASKGDGFYCEDGCKDGYTLKNCSRRCPENCQKCHQNTSLCISCMQGFTAHCDNEDCSKGSLFCKQLGSFKSEKWLVPFVVCAVLVIVVIVIVILIIIITTIFTCRRRSKRLRSLCTFHPSGQKIENQPLLNPDMTQDSLLHKACREDNLEAVKFLLRNKNQDIDSRGKGGMTPVMVAVGNGQGAVKMFLTSQGCDLSLVNNDKNTVLHIACRRNDVDFVKYLLKRKIFDINSKGSTGRTPVMMAAKCARKDIFELLRREGCDLSMKDDNNDSILHIACYSNNADFVKYVLELQIFDINAKGHRGYTPVLLAAYHGYRGVFDQLKNHKCDLHAVEEEGDNVLHIACQNDTNSEFVNYLLKLDIYDINKLGRRSRTPVMTAARFGCRQLFDILKEAGCKLKERDTDGDDVLALACRTNNEEFVKYLLSLDIYDTNREV